MYFHPAACRELRRMALFCVSGTLILTAIMGLIMDFSHQILIGAIAGCIVAIGNFACLCLTVQKAVGIENPGTRQALIQSSYNTRLLLQSGWVAAAFAIPQINVFAASFPLLLPGLSLFLRRIMYKKTQ